jgi:hypothetical protein
MENFTSKARSYITTKESQMHVIMHEEMMEELREQTRLLRHLVKLEKLDIQQPAQELKINTQKPAAAATTVKSTTTVKGAPKSVAKEG